MSAPAVDVSVLFAADAPLSLWRRTLWALASRPPSCPFEVVVAAATDAPLEELSLYSARFRWKFALCEEGADLLEVARQLADGRVLAAQDSRLIPWADAYDALVRPVWAGEALVSAGSVWEAPAHVLVGLDPYGADLSARQVALCRRWPVCTPELPSSGRRFFAVGASHWGKDGLGIQVAPAAGLLQSGGETRWAGPAKETPAPSRAAGRFPPVRFDSYLADHMGVREVRSNVQPG